MSEMTYEFWLCFDEYALVGYMCQADGRREGD